MNRGKAVCQSISPLTSNRFLQRVIGQYRTHEPCLEKPDRAHTMSALAIEPRQSRHYRLRMLDHREKAISHPEFSTRCLASSNPLTSSSDTTPIITESDIPIKPSTHPTLSYPLEIHQSKPFRPISIINKQHSIAFVTAWISLFTVHGNYSSHRSFRL